MSPVREAEFDRTTQVRIRGVRFAERRVCTREVVMHNKVLGIDRQLTGQHTLGLAEIAHSERTKRLTCQRGGACPPLAERTHRVGRGVDFLFKNLNRIGRRLRSHPERRTESERESRGDHDARRAASV